MSLDRIIVLIVLVLFCLIIPIVSRRTERKFENQEDNK